MYTRIRAIILYSCLIAKNGSAKTPSATKVIAVASPDSVVSPGPSEIIPAGDLDFTANKVINSLYTVYFEATGVPSGTYSYHWYFGDNKDSYSKTGVRTYGGSGTYQVILRIETPSGPLMKVKTMTLTNEGAMSLF